MAELTHLDDQGQARMVDVSEKPVTRRRAVASGEVIMKKETADKIKKGALEKGDVLAIARIAGIQAAKRTWELIPLAHPLPLSSVKVDFEVLEDRIKIRTEATAEAKTGVEMEALCAAAAAALAIYDMAKAVDRGMVISQIRLEEKSGGKSGEWKRT